MKAIAIILVGHSDWGKSKTLVALTGGCRNSEWWTLNDRCFCLRRKSNEDEPDPYWDFIQKLVPQETPCVLATFCPNFEKHEMRTEQILDELSKKYALFFFVLKHSWFSRADYLKTISPEEIERLREYGETEVFDQQGADEFVRAAAFRKYIEATVERC